MLHIDPSQVTPAITLLFDPTDMQAVRCAAVLDGRLLGHIYTDSPDKPSWAAVYEHADGTLFLGGAPSASVVAKLVAQLQHLGDVLVGLRPNDPRLALLPPGHAYDGWTLEFFDRDPAIDLNELQARVPAGYELRRVDAVLAQQSEGLVGWCAHFGGVDAFLQHNLGYCLLHDGQIVSDATAGPRALGLYEMGVSTHPDFRGRGFGTAVCAATIQACETTGLRTYWNCAKQNAASAALARKLGYRILHEHRLLAWDKVTI